jgi:membrane associated rhomboid family serine protease
MAKKYNKPSLTHFLIFVCIAVFLIEYYYRAVYGEDFLNNIFYEYGFSLQNILSQKVWVFVTSIFIHGGPEHLILNIIALYFFGRVVELELGRKKFLFAFFISAFVGDLLILVSNLIGFSSAIVPTVGASAAIFGLMGVAMLAKPFEFIFYPYLIPVPLILVALLYTLYNIGTFLVVLTGDTTSNISYVSHIGGLITGMLLGFTEEGSGKGFIALLFLLALLLLTPFVMTILGYLEIFNYVNIISRIFK